MTVKSLKRKKERGGMTNRETEKEEGGDQESKKH